MEELLYRGIVLGQLLLWMKPAAAVLISAILFGIFHFNVVQFLYAFLVGLLIGAVYVKTGRLFLCMLGHGLTNLMVLLMVSM